MPPPLLSPLFLSFCFLQPLSLTGKYIGNLTGTALLKKADYHSPEASVTDSSSDNSNRGEMSGTSFHSILGFCPACSFACLMHIVPASMSLFVKYLFYEKKMLFQRVSGGPLLVLTIFLPCLSLNLNRRGVI